MSSIMYIQMWLQDSFAFTPYQTDEAIIFINLHDCIADYDRVKG